MNRLPFKLMRTIITGDEKGNAVEIVEAVMRAVPVRYYEYEDADGWEVGFECAPPDNLVELVKQAMPKHSISEVVIDHERCVVLVKLVRIKEQAPQGGQQAQPQQGQGKKESKIDEVKKAL